MPETGVMGEFSVESVNDNERRLLDMQRDTSMFFGIEHLHAIEHLRI